MIEDNMSLLLKNARIATMTDGLAPVTGAIAIKAGSIALVGTVPEGEFRRCLIAKAAGSRLRQSTATPT